MKIFSSGIDSQGFIENRFGKFAEDIDLLKNTPIRSIPISWQDLPANIKSLALIMQDYDAIPVCGFSWIHWIVANIDPTKGILLENASRDDKNLVQGKNSLSSKQICGDMPVSLTNFYAGPRPPDKDHEYEITLYALDTVLDLKSGFNMNELIKAMKGHVLDSASIIGIYRS